MKFKHLFLVASLALLGFAACEPEEKDLGAPAATLSTQSVTIAQAGGTATVDVSATRGWALSTDADWIGYNPTSGKASEDATEITITVAANTEYDRSGEIYFEVGEGLITKVITVTQPGLKHKETHTGTVDSPYTVEEALEIINAGTYTDAEIERVKYLVGHHHTYTDIDGIDYQILVEADFLVNLHEHQNRYDSVQNVKKNIFRTETGLTLLTEMFCEPTV